MATTTKTKKKKKCLKKNDHRGRPQTPDSPHHTTSRERVIQRMRRAIMAEKGEVCEICGAVKGTVKIYNMNEDKRKVVETKAQFTGGAREWTTTDKRGKVTTRKATTVRLYLAPKGDISWSKWKTNPTRATSQVVCTSCYRKLQWEHQKFNGRKVKPKSEE